MWWMLWLACAQDAPQEGDPAEARPDVGASAAKVVDGRNRPASVAGQPPPAGMPMPPRWRAGCRFRSGAAGPHGFSDLPRVARAQWAQGGGDGDVDEGAAAHRRAGRWLSAAGRGVGGWSAACRLHERQTAGDLIQHRTSTDGVSWSEPVRLGFDRLRNWGPDIVAREDGTVVVCFDHAQEDHESWRHDDVADGVWSTPCH